MARGENFALASSVVEYLLFVKIFLASHLLIELVKRGCVDLPLDKHLSEITEDFMRGQYAISYKNTPELIEEKITQTNIHMVWQKIAAVFPYDERDTIREYGVKTKWYRSIDKPVGGSGWNELVFDLNDPSYFHSDSISHDKICPFSLKNILKIGIQLWANKTYTGKIYIDNVTIDGQEVKSSFNPRNEGFVKSNGIHQK